MTGGTGSGGTSAPVVQVRTAAGRLRPHWSPGSRAVWGRTRSSSVPCPGPGGSQTPEKKHTGKNQNRSGPGSGSRPGPGPRSRSRSQNLNPGPHQSISSADLTHGDPLLPLSFQALAGQRCHLQAVSGLDDASCGRSKQVRAEPEIRTRKDLKPNTNLLSDARPAVSSMPPPWNSPDGPPTPPPGPSAEPKLRSQLQNQQLQFKLL